MLGSVQPTKAQACSKHAKAHHSVSRAFKRALILELEMKENKKAPKDILSMNPLYPNAP